MKKAGILGSGAVAKALAKGLIGLGYEVMLGSRSPEKLTEWQASEGANAKAGTFEAAAQFGEMLVLAVKGSGALNAIREAGIENLKGKTIIDATNPIADVPPVDGVLQFFTGPNSSLMEQLQLEAPDAHFVKAFNSVGSSEMVHPQFNGIKPTMFICGNDEGAKGATSEVLQEFGWEIEDMGRATAARAIEPLSMLWCIPGFLKNEWSGAFKLLK